MNKNAYEIRLEVLQMANDALMALFAEKCAVQHAQHAKGCDMSINPKDLFPSVADIKVRAMELYKFVEFK